MTSHDPTFSERAAGTFDAVMDRLILPSFTKIGPAFRQRLFDWEPPQVAGRRVAVTGPTSGLGKAAAISLAEGGADLVLLARNPEKSHALAEHLKQIGAAGITEIEVDLGVPADLDRAGTALAELGRLDALIHNGGGLFNPRRETDDGIELTLALHVLAPIHLNRLALPALAAGDDPRVIMVSSGGMYTKPIELGDLQNERNYSGSVAYARAKRMQIVLGEHWADAWAPEGIGCHTMHPGWSNTPGVSDALPGFDKILGPLLRTPAQGADTMVWLSGAPSSEIGRGGFWLDRRERPTSYVSSTETSAADAATLVHEVTLMAEARSEIS